MTAADVSSQEDSMPKITVFILFNKIRFTKVCFNKIPARNFL
jgi:hypothetical protein